MKVSEKLINLEEPLFIFYENYEPVESKPEWVDQFKDSIKQYVSLSDYKVIGGYYNNAYLDYYGDAGIICYDFKLKSFYIFNLGHCSCYDIFDPQAWDLVNDDGEYYSTELFDEMFERKRLSTDFYNFVCKVCETD